MKDLLEEKRKIAIAEALGWQGCQRNGRDIIGIHPDNIKNNVLGCNGGYQTLPNFPEDLNALLEKRKIAVAEAMGATCRYRDTVIGPELLVFGPKTAFWDKYTVRSPEESMGSHTLPDFPNDLNAMHEAEKVFKRDEQLLYWNHLVKLVLFSRSKDETSYSIAHATAAQRFEAFLLNVGKWEEEEEDQANSPQPLSTIGTSGAGEGYKQHLASLSPH